MYLRFAIAMIAGSTAAFETTLSLGEATDLKSNLLKQFDLWNCGTCMLAFDGIDHLFNYEPFTNGLTKIASKICTLSGMTSDPNICHDATRQYEPVAANMLKTAIFGKQRWCNQKLELCDRVHIQKIDLHDVVDKILATKPLSLSQDDFIDKLYEEIATDQNERKKIKAVHISDVHLDLKYSEGSIASCDSMLCCRAEFGTPAQDDVVAGVWGSNFGLCDIPQKTFESLMEYVVSEIKPDIIFWTGDNSSHNIWNNTVEEVTQYTESVTNIIKDAIKDSDITVLPIHGNHDTWPVDSQDFSTPNSNYSINKIKGFWSDWLDEQAVQKYGEYGYYSQEITLKNGKALPAGSRVIALNTNTSDYMDMNMWGVNNDPGNQFAWLEQQLLEVEAQNGLAIILGHYTPNNQQHQFGVRYRALMERFQNVVRFGLAGHVHVESYNVTNSMTNPEKPIFMTSVGGSVTTYFYQNPSFMVLDIDSETMLPDNMYTYYTDVNEVDEAGNIHWSQLHDYLETYDMNDLRPSNLKDLAVRIFTQKELAEIFLKNKSRQNKYGKNVLDQLDLYCGLATSEAHELNKCREDGGMSAYGTDFKFFSKHFANAIVDHVIDNWVTYSFHE